MEVNKYSYFVWAQPKRPEYRGTKTGTFESLYTELDANTDMQVDLEDGEQQGKTTNQKNQCLCTICLSYFQS